MHLGLAAGLAVALTTVSMPRAVLTPLRATLATAPEDVDRGGEPLSTSCQCFAVTCSNGSTSAACQVTCTGQAVCSCASCTRAGSSSYLAGQNSCICQ
ncbi:MAG TPA: hypothetical protein VGG39_35085 [Polyangiaceae bacterium]